MNYINKHGKILRRRVIIKGIDDFLQADLVEMIAYESYNRGYRCLLTIIDTFSKKLGLNQ